MTASGTETRVDAGARKQAASAALDVSDDEVGQRAQAISLKRYYEGATEWRSWGTTGVLALLCLGYGALAFVPAVGEAMGVPPVAVMVLMALVAFNLIVSRVVLNVWGVASPAYHYMAMFDSTTFIAGSMLLVALAGTLASWFWVHLGLFFSGASRLTYRYTVYSRVLAASFVGLVISYAADGAWGRAFPSAVVGVVAYMFFRAATRSTAYAERTQAHAEILAERAGEALAVAERQRIARDLHDGLGAELTNVLWHAQGIEGGDEGEVDELVERVRSSLAELRSAVHGAKREPMRAGAFAVELRRVVGLLEGDEPALHVRCKVTDQHVLLTSEVCAHMLAVVKEGVQNARMHARAQRVDVTLTVDEEISLVVADDGVGMSDEVAASGGLRHVRARAGALGANVTWRARARGGTAMTFALPLDRAQHESSD